MAVDLAKSSDVAAPAPPGRRRTLADRDNALAWIFLMPSVIYIVALVAIPFFLAVGFAMSDVTSGDPSFDFVGFANFSAVFHDPVFWRSLRNTFVFTAVSMVLIVVLDWVLRKIGILDDLIVIFSDRQNPGPGENMYWLGEPGLAMTSVIIVHVWR